MGRYECNEFQNEKEDILSRYLVESKKDPENMNDQYLMDVILNFIIAGKDSTANTLSWFFYVVCKNPLVQERILQEIRDVFGNKYDKSSIEDFVETISDEILEKMHYLHAALSETLRLYPAVPVVSIQVTRIYVISKLIKPSIYCKVMKTPLLINVMILFIFKEWKVF